MYFSLHLSISGEYAKEKAILPAAVVRDTIRESE